MPATPVAPGDLRPAAWAAKKLGLDEAGVITLITSNALRAQRSPDGTFHVDKRAVKALKATSQPKSMTIAEAANKLGLYPRDVEQLVEYRSLVGAQAATGETRVTAKSVKRYMKFQQQTKAAIDQRHDREVKARDKATSGR